MEPHTITRLCCSQQMCSYFSLWAAGHAGGDLWITVSDDVERGQPLSNPLALMKRTICSRVSLSLYCSWQS